MNKYTLCRVAASVAATAALFFAVWCVITYDVVGAVCNVLSISLTVLFGSDWSWSLCEIFVIAVSIIGIYSARRWLLSPIGNENAVYEITGACGLGFAFVFWLFYVLNEIVGDVHRAYVNPPLDWWVWFVPLSYLVIIVFYESRVSKFACRVFNKKGD